MKNQAKADIRVKTLNTIEKLDVQVQNLKVGSASTVGEQPVGRDYDGPTNTEGWLWEYTWRLDLDDINNKSFFATLDEIYSIINSKEALRKYPRGMYRELIEFSDKCDERRSWIEAQNGNKTIWDGDDLNQKISEEANRTLASMVKAFRKDIKAVLRSIYFYENEREESEESFIEEKKAN